jgi:hypothetical protein
MVNNQRRFVRFADYVEEIEKDNNTEATDRYSDYGSSSLNKPAVSSDRSAWNPNETSLSFQHQSPPQKLDLAPRQPIRSLNSILTEALRTCEHFAILPGNEDIDESSSSSPSSLQYDEANHSLGLPSSFFSYSNNEDDAATFHLPPLPTLYRRHHIPVRSSCTFSQAM